LEFQDEKPTEDPYDFGSSDGKLNISPITFNIEDLGTRGWFSESSSDDDGGEEDCIPCF